MKNIFKYIKPAYYEFLSYFVSQKVKYDITGNCKMCGKCCNYMYSVDTYTEKEFKLMQFLYPSYKRFRIVGKDDEGHMIFACSLVGKDGKCTVYNKRLNMCKNYPAKHIYFNGKLHDGCGYQISPQKSFDDYLK